MTNTVKATRKNKNNEAKGTGSLGLKGGTPGKISRLDGKPGTVKKDPDPLLVERAKAVAHAQEKLGDAHKNLSSRMDDLKTLFRKPGMDQQVTIHTEAQVLTYKFSAVEKVTCKREAR